MSKFEQCLNLKFLVKLGKNEHEAYRLLRKAYGDRCMSRVCALAYFNEYIEYSKQQQCKVEETGNADAKMDTDYVENTESPSNRIRANSVIDSSCIRKYNAVLETRKVRIRSKSLSTTDYHTSAEIRCINEMKKSDITDAKANISLNDEVSDPVCVFKEPVAIASVSKDAECYNMNHKNRGKCIIFNHEKFDLGYDKREGTSLDAERLEVTFGNLGFDVEVCNDFTHSKIMAKIDEVSQLDHTDNDCLCVITLTHGVQDDLLCACDVIYKSDGLWKPFAADKCITLAGKPKLFFIQACRGDKSDGGVRMSPRNSTQVQNLQTETDSVVAYAIPAHADFLIAHSSIQGFFTWRNPLEGTWYIQCLCDILDQHGTTMDLMSILTRTARKVATDFSSVNTENLTLHNKKQVPSVTSMLLRTVYFPPKSRESHKNSSEGAE